MKKKKALMALADTWGSSPIFQRAPRPSPWHERVDLSKDGDAPQELKSEATPFAHKKPKEFTNTIP